MCGEEFDEFHIVEEMHNAVHCGEKAIKLLSKASIGHGLQVKDSKGTPIWFPKDDSPYFDRALQRPFKSRKEKKEYMNQNKLIMDGSTNPSKWSELSGDMRDKTYRKKIQAEE